MSEHEHDHAHDDGPYGEAEVHAHIGSYKSYFAVFMGLIFFTLLTVGVASIHLGKANLAVAVIIASLKAALVCTFFMHLKDDNKFNALILISAITFIGVFFALTLNDVDYRTQLDVQSGNRVFLQSGSEAPGSWVNPIQGEGTTGGEGSKVEPAPTTTATASAQPGLAPTMHGAIPSAVPSTSAMPAPTTATSAAGSAAPHASASAAPHAAPKGSASAKPAHS